MAKPEFVFQFPENYPDVLEQMGQVIGRTLLKHGLKKPQAQVVAFESVEGIRSDLGGAFLYINKGVSYELSLRDREIWEEFDGKNYFELSKKHKLSEMQIRNIINAIRAQELAKRQGSLSFD
jgi:Mor family transcriptional regulator